MLVDTHCHLDFDRFDKDRDDVVRRAAEAGVMQIIVPAIDLNSCRAVLKLADKYEGIYAAVGVHPNSSAGWQDSWVGTLRDLAQHEKVVAIGEIGLDYYRERSPKDNQHRAFRGQLALAAELDLPVIVHNRESDADVIRLLAASPLTRQPHPGVLHSFSAAWETAVSALELGYFLGFTGPVTFKKADDLRRTVSKTPRDRLLVETDAPFLAPHPYRGKRNEPAYVVLVAERIAAIHGLQMNALAGQTTRNAWRLFKKIKVEG